jgi:hypothetical protein
MVMTEKDTGYFAENVMSDTTEISSKKITNKNMELRWIQPGRIVSEGVEEGILEIDYLPGIPMEVLFGNPQPQDSKDAEEREWLLLESDKAAEEIIRDPLTRRALFYDNYPGALKTNCFSLFHFTVRKGRLNLFVYVRSMNMKNMGYDLITIDKTYNRVKENLIFVNPVDLQREEVEIGKITIHIHCLHYIKA